MRWVVSLCCNRQSVGQMIRDDILGGEFFIPSETGETMEISNAGFQDDEEYEDGIYCATLLTDGKPLPPPDGTCWCDLLREKPGDEILLELGKSVLECLTLKGGSGQDDAMLIILELRI